jgi:hypothetical protein
MGGDAATNVEGGAWSRHRLFAAADDRVSQPENEIHFLRKRCSLTSSNKENTQFNGQRGQRNGWGCGLEFRKGPAGLHEENYDENAEQLTKSPSSNILQALDL